MSAPTGVVIGAGFGGLALAIRMQSAGIRTTLLEKRDRLGGRAYVYEQDGFRFDAGPTVITDPTAIEELFALSGRKLADYAELIPIEPLYRLYWEDGTTLDYANDRDRLESEIARLSPSDLEGYRRFKDYAEDVFQEGYVKLGHVPFLRFRSMLAAAPALARVQGYRSVHSIVAKYIRDPHLRQAFSFHTLLVGGDPFRTSSIYALIHALERRWGVFFPRGGTGALVEALGRLFTDLGGEITLGAGVRSIAVEGKRARSVTTEGGTTIEADVIATNADIVHTYRDLLSGTERGRKATRRLERKRFSMSLFVVYFGLRGRYPDLAHHSILFGPRYRDLIAEIFKGPDLPEDFSIYLHAPSTTDSSMAPEGDSAFYALAPVPHLGSADVDWSIEGPKLRDRILESIERRVLPGLRENLVTMRIFTPADFRDELNSHLGSAFSLEPILTQSAFFRTHNRDDEIGNLYFVGAGTHPGAGIPGVVGSAKATAGLILDDFGLSKPAAA